VSTALRRALLATSLLICGVAQAAEKAAPAEQLREIGEQKDKVEFLLRQVETKRMAVLAVLETIEQEVRTANEAAVDAHRKAVAAGGRLKTARDREATIEKERLAIARELGPRLLLRYRLRGSSYLQALLTAPSVGDVLWRQRMIDRILKNDFVLIEKMAGVQDEAKQAREAVESQKVAFAEAEKTARERGAEAKKRRDLQAAVLAGLQKEKSTHLRTMSELERARQQLMDAIAALPPPPPGLGGFGRERGRLAWPTDGTVEVAFGRQVDPKFKTVLQQKGYDIRASAGTVVRAPYGAAVAFAGWFSGFGNLVILDHGEGYYTLYAHLQELKVQKGERVDEAAEIGLVGDTGSLKGAYLYFEIRSGSKALDPAEWLVKR
jgi:septal ring factor EnvC (AmiA/AmiB activator)